MIWSAPTSSRLATYIVRLAIRTWLGSGLAECGRHQGRCCHLRLGQHRAVGEEAADPLAEPGIEDRDDQPELRAQLLRAQRGVKVAEVVLMQDRQAARGGQVRGQEGVGVSSARSSTRTPGIAAIRAPCSVAADGTITITPNP